MLSQHSLNKGRSKRLVSAVAALSLFFGAAHVAPTASAQEIGAKFSIDEADKGYRITDGSKTVLAELFSATSGGETRLAYCNELEVNFQKTNNAYAAKWSEFPGNNKFKTDENVRQKVNWIAANSYPAVSYETMLQKAGVTASQVSKQSMISQTQAAIWHLGSGYNYKGLAQGQGTAEEQQNAKKVYDYLLGPANVGRAESTSVDLQVGFKGKDTAKRQDNGTFGPFTLDTNASSVEVTAETGQVVDKNGKAFPANEIKNGEEFYFKAEEQAGTAKLTAKAATSEVNGALIISPTGNGGHHQTLIVTHDKNKTKEAELYIEWEGTNARLSTTARKKGDEHSQRVKSKGGTIVDIVAYEGLIVGKEYTLKGQLYERVKQEDGSYKGVATDIKAEKKFTPVQAKDEVHLEFEIPEGYAGKTLVVFEEAYGPDGKLIAKHDDINDENQTIYVNQPYQDMSSDSSAAKTGSAGAMFAGSSKCFAGGAAGGSSKKEDKNKGSLGDLFAGSSSLFGGDKDKDKNGSDTNGGSTNGGNGNGNANGGSTGNGNGNGQGNANGGSTGNGNGNGQGNANGGSTGNGNGNGGANGGSDSNNGSNAGGVAGSAAGAGAIAGSSSDKDKDKKDNGSTAGSSNDNNGNGNGQGNGGANGTGGSDSKNGSNAGGNAGSDANAGSNGTAGSSGEGNGNGQGNGNGGSTAGSSGEGNGQGNGGANGNGGSDSENGSDSNNKNGSALAGSASTADCGGALALGALAIGGLVLTAVGFNVLARNAAPAPLAGAADPRSDTKGAAPAAGDPNNKNAANSNTKGAEPKEKGVAHKDPNTTNASQMDVKSASPAKSNSALANTGVSGILIMLAIAAVAAVAGGALIFFGRRKKN